MLASSGQADTGNYAYDVKQFNQYLGRKRF